MYRGCPKTYNKMEDFLTKFKQVVQKYPQNVAVLTNEESALTYSELYKSAINVAYLLKSRGIKKGDIVAIHLRKSPEYIIALLGVWFSGAAFLPLSPNLPKKRKAFILNEANPVFIIGSSKGGKTLNIHDILATGVKGAPSVINLLPEDLAYVIYTSGSTGEPKGVMVNHSGIVNILEQQIKVFQLNAASRSLFLLSISFDASLSDIGTALLSGATICIEGINDLEVAARLPEIIAKRKITYVDIPPSLLNVLEPEQMPDCLKTIVIGGESLAVKTIKKWAEKFRLVSVYGPTEATICTSMIVCDPITWDGPDIGPPIVNIEYKILNGELLIAGIGLARGYLNRPDLTKEKFFYLTGKRYYRTGDIVREVGGKIYFVGRKDRQLKIHGQLVAPEEIEAQLQSYKYVARAAVILKNEKLIAFVQFKKGRGKETEILKKYLKRFLPDWMIPRQIVALEKIPSNVNGKINYGELENFIGQPVIKSIQTEIVSGVAMQLKAIWEKVLERKNIGINENFFSIGGDSLAALQVVTEAKKYGINIPIGLLAQKPTIRALVKWHGKNKNKIISDGAPVTRFKKDITIGKGWKKLFKIGKNLPQKSGALFITGATGFLGPRLLKELLAKTDKSAYVLVRAVNSKEALKRILAAGARYGVNFTSSEIKRIRAVPGDVTRPRLGMSLRNWQKLAREVSDIYHCAAIVNMVKTYQELKSANVDSIKEIVKFALTGNKKKVNYTSTLSVFVATDKNTGVLLENDDLSRIKIIYGGYAQSKWVIERFLQQIPNEVLGINIFRLGLLTGDSKTGAYSDHDYLKMFVQGIIRLGAVPEGQHNSIALDVTPVDYAAKAIAYIGLKSPDGTYHVANKGGFTLKMILDALKKRGIKLKILSSGKWRVEAQAKELSQEESAAFMALCRLMPGKKDFEQLRSMDLFQATNVDFDQTNVWQYLKSTPIIAPKPDTNLLDKYIKLMLKHG